MAWKFESGVALTIQIVDKLRSDILSGIYQKGGQFPTVRQLAFEAGVNPNTMQKALCLLEDEGLLETQSTLGRSVTHDSAVLAAARHKYIKSFTDKIVKEALMMELKKSELIEYIEKGWIENE